MLKLKSYRQRPSHCGPACLKMIFEYYGVKASEATIGKIAGCTFERGTPPQGLIKAALAYGFRGAIKKEAGFVDLSRALRKKIPVIVNWFSTDEGHYSVVVGLDKRHVYLQDPEIGKLRAIKRDVFRRVWFDFRGSYLKQSKDLRIRWMILIEKYHHKDH